MICAEFFNEKGVLIGFRINGHSGAAGKGDDIVCAAVSSAAYLTANTVTDVVGAEADVKVKDGYMELRISGKNAAECMVPLKGFRLHMEELQKQYSKYLYVHDTEV